MCVELSVKNRQLLEENEAAEEGLGKAMLMLQKLKGERDAAIKAGRTMQATASQGASVPADAGDDGGCGGGLGVHAAAEAGNST
mmetsp:Transcript_92905/g.298935  ORF Transcript_92905/g.298935 Transcript_92905/m.298935 type:complete len:84 (-) Transcript_92905:468-719(-)